MLDFFSKQSLPESLNICLIGQRFQILSRSSDHGFLWPIARGLAKKGHKVTVLSTTSPLGKQEIVRDGVRAFYLLEGDKKLARQKFEDVAYKKFIQLNKETPFHIVHSLDKAGSKIILKKNQFNAALAIDVQATQMSHLFSILGMGKENLGSLISTAATVTYKFITSYYGGDRQLLKNADGVFVTSPQQRIILERYYLYPDARIYQVPYAVEISDLAPKEQSLTLKSQHGLPDNAHIIVSLSDMTELREVVYLLKAFEKLAIKKPNAYLFILGHGPLWKEIEFEALNLALGSKVIMTGAINNQQIADYICLADVYVNMSTRSTGIETGLVEAMAQKKIVIGSEVSPMAQIINDGEDGFLLRPADVDSLGELFIDIFSQNLIVEQMGEKARNKVVEIFDSKNMLNAALEAYNQILLHTGRYKLDKPKSSQ